MFSGHTVEELRATLEFFKENDYLGVELLDAFLSEYKKNGNLDDSIFFARCEWDV